MQGLHLFPKSMLLQPDGLHHNNNSEMYNVIVSCVSNDRAKVLQTSNATVEGVHLSIDEDTLECWLDDKA